MTTANASRSLEELQHPGWLGLLLIAAFTVRAYRVDFNSAFEGESAMILMGRRLLEGGVDVTGHMRTSFGWYLWPVIAATADRFGGLGLLRLVAAGLGTVAVLGVFLFTRRLFDERAAFVAALFGAVFMPAVLSSHVATPDALGMALLAAMLAAFARAWSSNVWSSSDWSPDGRPSNQSSAGGGSADGWPYWLVAALLAVALVLVKHVLVVLLPVLCVAAWWHGRPRAALGRALFTGVVVFAIGAYVARYADVLRGMLALLANTASARAQGDDLVQRYVRDVLDIWLLGACALVALIVANREGGSDSSSYALRARRAPINLLVATAALLALSPSPRALDPHGWAHVVYPALVLLPVAAAGVLVIADRLLRRDRSLSPWLVTLVAVSLYLLRGQTATRDGIPLSWPNSAVVARFLHERIQSGQRVLLDDAAVRYLLDGRTPQERIVDEHAREVDGMRSPQAFTRAVADGAFDYVVLDGNNSDDARALQNAIDPVILTRYVERMRALQPNTGADAVIYERVQPPVSRASDAPTIVLTEPRPNATIVADGPFPSTAVVGDIAHLPANARLSVDVFTNSWYPQGDTLNLSVGTGHFARRIVLGGEGAERCAHIVRVRLLSADQRILHEVLVPGIRRTTADSASIPCPSRSEP